TGRARESSSNSSTAGREIIFRIAMRCTAQIKVPRVDLFFILKNDTEKSVWLHARDQLQRKFCHQGILRSKLRVEVASLSSEETSMKFTRCFAAGGFAALATGSLLLISCSTMEPTIVAPPEIPGATFVGNKVCYDCHTNIVRIFPASPHARV